MRNFMDTPKAGSNRLAFFVHSSFAQDVSGEPTPAVRNGSVASGKIQLVCD
jgi:hypothetical protein